MIKQASFISRFDPRALPVPIKIAIGLGMVLLISGIVTDQVIQQVVRDSLLTVTLGDLKVSSRAQGFRLANALEQEIGILNKLGSTDPIQAVLSDHMARDATRLFSSGESLYHPDATIALQVRTFKLTHEELSGVTVLDANGHILAMEPVPANISQVAAPDWPWFQAAYDQGNGTTFIFSRDDKLTGLTGIHVAIPVYRQQAAGQLIGIIYGVWNMSNAPDLAEPGTDRQGLITQEDGAVLLAPSGEQDVTVPAEIVTHAGGGAFTFTDSQWLYGYVRMTELGIEDPIAGRLPWIVMIRQPVSSLQASTILLLTRVRLVIAISVVVVTVVILGFASVLFAPLRRLIAAAMQIERGELRTPIPDLPHDEIGHLAGVLNHVVQLLLSRIDQLRAAVQVSRAASVTLDVDQMLLEVAQALAKQFGYPDVRIFQTDSTGKRIRLQAAVGGESERLLRTGYRLLVDETSLVGRAMLLNEPLMGGGREVMRKAGLIMEHSELVLPLRASGQSIGAIHLIAGRLREFRQDDLDVLRLITDQVGVSIQNARLFEQSAANLAEIEALNRRLTRQVWEEYGGDEKALRRTLDPEQQWPQTPSDLRQRTEIRAETYTDADGRLVLAAPLVLRGEVVGTLAVTRPAGERWTRDEATLLESIAMRMGIIAEGIRLVEESTRRAEREQRVNEVSASLLQRATSVDTVLRSALSELGNVLGSDRVSLRIGGMPVRDDHQLAAESAEASPDGNEAAPESNPQSAPAATGGDGDGGMTDDE